MTATRFRLVRFKDCGEYRKRFLQKMKRTNYKGYMRTTILYLNDIYEML